MDLGHIIYIGNDRDSYLNAFEDETKSFIEVQNVSLTIWDDKMIQELMKNNFDSYVLNAYNTVQTYPYKADLARLCILYVHGGWHSDIGIRFIKKIVADKEIIVFNDNALKRTFDYENIIQNAVIYSIPKQAEILECIDRLSNIYNNKEYGKDAAYIGGTAQMGKVFKQQSDRIGIGEFGDSFTNLEDLLSGKTILQYLYNDVHVADFKNYKKKELIPLIEPEKMLWGMAWKNRKVYK
jgi:hypothetical protein